MQLKSLWSDYTEVLLQERAEVGYTLLMDLTRPRYRSISLPPSGDEEQQRVRGRSCRKLRLAAYCDRHVTIGRG